MKLQSDTGRATILVVDDDHSLRRLVVRILEPMGHECIEAQDAAEARRVLGRRSVDLVLSDILMPGESGLDLLRWIRAQRPDTAVVMVTVIDDLETARKALEMDIYGYVLKPVDAHQLLITVINALRRLTLEIRRRAHRAEMEETVRQRTTELRVANETLSGQEKELRRRTQELEELNAALRVLLNQREKDKSVIEQRLVNNVQRTIKPYLEKLCRSALSAEQRHLVEILSAGLSEIVTPFVNEISSAAFDLTPAEIQVAELIRQGRSTKEIAAILNLSPNTVMTHRYNLRTKLGLKNSKRNLHSFLATRRQ